MCKLVCYMTSCYHAKLWNYDDAILCEACPLDAHGFKDADTSTTCPYSEEEVEGVVDGKMCEDCEVADVNYIELELYEIKLL